MRKANYTDDDLRRAVAESLSCADVLRRFGLAPRGGNYKTIKHHVRRLGLDTSHWLGRGHLRGKPRPWLAGFARPLSDILKDGSHVANSGSLKRRLISEGFLDERCARCGLTEWLDAPISLHLDHANGQNTDNRLENLRLLCPNCHSQTDTYCGKNWGKYLGLKRAKPKEPVRAPAPPPEPLPPGWQLTPRKTKITWPADAELRRMVDSSSVLAVGRALGVSDNAVRKRLLRAERLGTCAPVASHDRTQPT
jgi:hypothetical protein